MSAGDETIPLWSGTPPGAVVPGQEQHERAKETPQLKLFLLAGDRPRPLVVVLPGGGYGGRAPHEADPVAQWLNGIGLHALVCHYRVFPWRHPAPLADAQRAVRRVRHQAAAWQVDPSRVGVLGFSAGGHLACSVANFGDDGDAASDDPVARQRSRADALIACYPVVSFGPRGHQGSRINLIGDSPDPALLRRLSLENSVTPRNPPAFLWHSANDAGVPVANSLLYAQALSDANVPFSLHVYPDAQHGIGLGRDHPGSARGWTQACEAWLQELRWV
ncbi:MAG: alpha/beta hydrolase [bacterium]